MNEQQRFLLISKEPEIGEDLEPKDILSYLQSKFVLDVSEVEIIKNAIPMRNRVKTLLSMLPDKGSDAFIHFYDALIDSSYSHLAKLLTSGLNDKLSSNGIENESSSDTLKTMLRDGGVPKMPHFHTERPKEVKKLRNELQKLEDADGWVLLHGMAGSGKTVLAVDALHDQELIDTCFPGGVFWVTLGKVDASRLLMKMQNLCAWLDSDKSIPVPRNVEEARDRLRILFSHQHPRSLLVLDDIWDSEDARYFDIRARTLATSRNALVIEKVAGDVSIVEIEEGLSDDQSKHVLAQWTHQTPASLPSQATGLIRHCKGSPLAISMLGALLKARPKRWDYYLEQMKGGNISKLKSKLGYEYPTLYDAISMSVTELEEDVQDKYKYFAVFEEDSRIPASLLALLWDATEIDVEDLMDELVSRSLAKRYLPSNDQQFDSYGIHDLQLSYLKECQSDSELTDKHKTLITKYSAKVNGDFAKIENDGYIYWNIINHLIKAKMVDKAVTLLLSFEWIEAKLKATGAPYLINNYHKVMAAVGNEVKNQLREYVHFIGINSYLLSTPGHQEYGLIQLALAQPFATGVHKAAKNIVMSEPNNEQFYVGWCNRPEESSETCLLTVKLHNGPVYCCHWSPDNSDRIVSCGGGDFNIKIWNACNTETLFTLSGHTDTVKCCQFSPDSRKVVSASADNSFKLWDAVTGSLKYTFKGHCGDVNCSTFSPVDSNLIASCSADNTIKLWDTSALKLIRTLDGHTDAVNWCCFSPDGKRLASVSNDCTLKIWNVDDGTLIKNYDQFENFISYCVYHPLGKQIMATSQHSLQFFDTDQEGPSRSIHTMLSVLSIAFSPDGKFAVGTHADATAQLWNVEGRSCVGVFRGHSGWLHSVSFSPDGKRIVTTSEDETCKVWKVEPVEELSIKLRKVFDARCDVEGGSKIAVANNDHEIQVIDGLTGKYIKKTASLGSKITSCKLSLDGKRIIAGLETGLVKVIDTESCTEISSTARHSSAINDCITTPDGAKVITASEDCSIKIWNLEAKEQEIECNGHKDTVVKCALFHKSPRFVSASHDGSAKVWDINDGKCLLSCKHSEGSLLFCAVSPDDKMIASTSADTTAKLWCALTGNLLRELEGHSDCVRCCAFSPDSSIIVTGSDESIIKIWSTETGEDKATLKGHKVWVTDIHFSPDGKSFVSVSSDIKWWKQDGTLLQTFLVRGNYLKQIITSKNFDRFITIDDTGQLYILDEMK